MTPPGAPYTETLLVPKLLSPGLRTFSLPAATKAWAVANFPPGRFSIVLFEGDRPIVDLELRGPCEGVTFYHPTEDYLKAGTFLSILAKEEPS